MLVRGKWLEVDKHALEGMNAERPPITLDVACLVLDAPDYDDGKKAYKRVGRRTVLLYYDEEEGTVTVHGASATRSRLET